MRGINKVILIGELNQNPETVVIIGQQELSSTTQLNM